MRENDSYVLVLGGSDDGQLVAVLDALRDRNVPVVFLDHCTTLDAAFDIRAGGGLEIRLDGKQLPLPAVVWSRLKINTLISSWTSETVNEFIRRSEWRGFLSTISAALGDLGIYTLSDVAESGSRIRQLEIAARCGFVVPESTWFVGKAHAERFAAKHERIVAKPIAVRNVPKLEDDLDSYRVLFTMGIEGAEIAAIDPSEFTGAPALFQERIGHGVEHRVIAFRDRAFSYEIKGRIEDKIRPDERILYGANDGRRIYGAQYNFVETSPFVAQATSRFLTEAGLQYGAFDLIKGDSGQWSFIECNPEGQWYAASMFNMDEVAAHFAKLIEGQLHQQRRNTLEPIPEAIA